MAKIYFVVTSWAMEDAGYQFGREFSPATRSEAKAQQMFEELVQKERARLLQENPSWLDMSGNSDSCTMEEGKWEVWEDGCFDDNHITIELVETEEDYKMYGPNIRFAIFCGISSGGSQQYGSCKVDMQTREVFDIESTDEDCAFVHDKDINEEIIFIDGSRATVCRKEDVNDSKHDFWYDPEKMGC